ncbi:MAG: UDP-N-acetylglucosamine 2-epimerase (non-hydrolyzing) [Candidatus Cloacimonetes bacterium]|nr:UDP-N-acetylglucosamine 2-epimerase (non-hydrolyzing) [Candidatus Cloacimonadota bacterium]
MKTIVTITGIRPDFIRMSKVFVKLDENFDHIMIHTGQHYDDELSKIFFKELKLRLPDFTLATGTSSKNHYEQLSYLSKALIELLKEKDIKPDLIMFLGDSNSVMVSAPLFKEGYKIGHIEGGMRSYDRRMPEEVNRVICDYVSDYIFVYTSLYKERLIKENKDPENIFVVGNTIVEVVKQYIPIGEKKKDYIVADIHRNENLKDVNQYNNLLEYLNYLGKKLNLPIKLVKFRRAVKLIKGYNLLDDKPFIHLAGPYGFLKYLDFQYNAYGVVSDSGTSQEECPLLKVPVAVPRNYTERPESIEFGNSILVGETNPVKQMVEETISFFKSYTITNDKIKWIGDGNTSQRIINILKEKL